MSINIDNYNYEGPFGDTSQLKNQSGVYVILGRSSNAHDWNVVDVGESATVRDRVENHDRSACWKRQGHSQLQVAAYYCNERERMQLEQQLRKQFKPPCGDR